MGGWMDALRQASKIRSAPKGWVTQDAQKRAWPQVLSSFDEATSRPRPADDLFLVSHEERLIFKTPSSAGEITSLPPASNSQQQKVASCMAAEKLLASSRNSSYCDLESSVVDETSEEAYTAAPLLRDAAAEAVKEGIATTAGAPSKWKASRRLSLNLPALDVTCEQPLDFSDILGDDGAALDWATVEEASAGRASEDHLEGWSRRQGSKSNEAAATLMEEDACLGISTSSSSQGDCCSEGQLLKIPALAEAPALVRLTPSASGEKPGHAQPPANCDQSFADAVEDVDWASFWDVSEAAAFPGNGLESLVESTFVEQVEKDKSVLAAPDQMRPMAPETPAKMSHKEVQQQTPVPERTFSLSQVLLALAKIQGQAPTEGVLQQLLSQEVSLLGSGDNGTGPVTPALPEAGERKAAKRKSDAQDWTFETRSACAFDWGDAPAKKLCQFLPVD